MRYAALAIAAAAFLRLTGAQSTSATSSSAMSSMSMTATASGSDSSYTVDPSTVSPATRQSWCSQQITTCRFLCPNQDTTQNSCDQTTLDWTCQCAGGVNVNVSDYANTVPSQSCTAWVEDCANNSTDAEYIQNTCRSVVCGNKGTAALQSSYSASAEMASSTTASSSASGSATGSSTGSTASSTESGAAVALALGQSYGFAGIVCAFAAAFGLAL